MTTRLADGRWIFTAVSRPARSSNQWLQFSTEVMPRRTPPAALLQCHRERVRREAGAAAVVPLRSLEDLLKSGRAGQEIVGAHLRKEGYVTEDDLLAMLRTTNNTDFAVHLMELRIGELMEQAKHARAQATVADVPPHDPAAVVTGSVGSD